MVSMDMKIHRTQSARILELGMLLLFPTLNLWVSNNQTEVALSNLHSKYAALSQYLR